MCNINMTTKMTFQYTRKIEISLNFLYSQLSLAEMKINWCRFNRGLLGKPQKSYFFSSPTTKWGGG